MQPEAIALFIESHQPASAVDDRSPGPKRLGALGLHRPCPGFQFGGLKDLQPGHPSHQPDQAQTQQGKDGSHATRWNRLERNHTPA